MSSSFAAQISASMAIRELGTAINGVQPKWEGSIGVGLDFTHGTGLAQFDLAYMAERSVASGGTDAVDLVAALTSALGVSFDAVEIAMLMIKNAPQDPSAAANSTNLTLGGGSNKVLGQFDSMVLRPGAFVLAGGPSASGLLALTADTADILQIVNSAGATAKYQIGILGRSA